MRRHINIINKTRKPGARHMAGVSLVETALVLPVLLMIGLGVLQQAFVYEARTTLNYATLMAARAGAVEHARPSAIRLGLSRGLAPLYSPNANQTGQLLAMGKAGDDIRAGNVHFSILNPTREAFADFHPDDVARINGQRIIPSSTRYLRSQGIHTGSASGINVQDANLFKLQVIYGMDLKVPMVGPLIAELGGALTRDPIKQRMFQNGRLPILSTATVRMQSDAIENDWVLNRQQVEANLVAGLTPTDPNTDSGEAGGNGGDGSGRPGSNGEGDIEEVDDTPPLAGGPDLPPDTGCDIDRSCVDPEPDPFCRLTNSCDSELNAGNPEQCDAHDLPPKTKPLAV